MEKQDQNSQYGAELDHYFEDFKKFRCGGHGPDIVKQDQMPRAADGQPFCDTLYDTENDRL